MLKLHFSKQFRLLTKKKKWNSILNDCLWQINNRFSNSGKLERIWICSEAQWAGGRYNIDRLWDR